MAWCAVVAVFGLVLSGAGLEASDGLARAALAVLGHPGVAFPPEMRFAVALTGAVTLGWAATLAAVVAASTAIDMSIARRMWRGIALGVGIWFVVDSALSIATGFARNAVSNTVLMVALLVILGRGRMLATG